MTFESLLTEAILFRQTHCKKRLHRLRASTHFDNDMFQVSGKSEIPQGFKGTGDVVSHACKFRFLYISCQKIPAEIHTTDQLYFDINSLHAG